MTYRTNRSEAEDLAELVDINVAFAGRMACPSRRSEHGKGIADLRATFTVLDHLPKELRAGLFAQPGRYDATVRFSNSATENDARRDAHGFALKLHDVPMDSAPKGPDGTRIQDFILLDCPTFVMGDLAQYIPFNRAFLDAKLTLRGKLDMALLLLRNPGRILPLLRLGLIRANAPLSTTYWSTTPYRLGALVVKYKAVPITPEHPKPRIRGKDGRRDALRRHLSRGPGLFSFGVLIQTDPEKHPIDRPEIDWEDHAAAFTPLAEICIPQDQPVSAPETIENALTFSPGHAAREHFPLGAINRARVAIYAAASRTRQQAADRGH